MKKSILFTVVLTSIFITGQASAALYEYERNNGTLGGGSGGTFDQLYTSYDSNSSQLTWTTTNANITDSGAIDGFWLVLNDGPNPKTANVNELAIFYADFSSNTLLAYAYNGANNANSINSPGILIGDYSSSIINTGGTVGFSLDASAINSFTHSSITASAWKGAQYDDDIGIWFHSSFGSAITGNAQSGYDYGYSAQRWYDTANESTTVSSVPLPPALYLFASGLIGLAARRKKLKVTKLKLAGSLVSS